MISWNHTLSRQFVGSLWAGMNRLPETENAHLRADLLGTCGCDSTPAVAPQDSSLDGSGADGRKPETDFIRQRSPLGGLGLQLALRLMMDGRRSKEVAARLCRGHHQACFHCFVDSAVVVSDVESSQ